MSSKEVGIEEARKRLGDLVTAAQQGTDIILTRNGKPAARIVRMEAPVSQIVVVDNPNHPTDPFAAPIQTPTVVGSFDAHLAQYWQGSGTRRVNDPDAAGGGWAEDLSGQRLWFTADGRWALTSGKGPAVYLTDDQAEEWFTACGLTAEDRETYVRTL